MFDEDLPIFAIETNIAELCKGQGTSFRLPFDTNVASNLGRTFTASRTEQHSAATVPEHESVIEHRTQGGATANLPCFLHLLQFDTKIDVINESNVIMSKNF